MRLNMKSGLTHASHSQSLTGDSHSQWLSKSLTQSHSLSVSLWTENWNVIVRWTWSWTHLGSNVILFSVCCKFYNFGLLSVRWYWGISPRFLCIFLCLGHCLISTGVTVRNGSNSKKRQPTFCCYASTVPEEVAKDNRNLIYNSKFIL